jgi:uncharacterized protein (DUF2147 family)
MKLVVLLLISSFFIGYSQNTDKVIGVYWTPEKDGKIEIYCKNNKFYGKILTGDNPTRKDTLNPNKNLRNRTLVGAEFMYDFEKEDDIYVNGQIYDPNNGKTYKCKMWLEGTNLNVRGFIGFSLLGRTAVFTRFK